MLSKQAVDKFQQCTEFAQGFGPGCKKDSLIFSALLNNCENGKEIEVLIRRTAMVRLLLK